MDAPASSGPPTASRPSRPGAGLTRASVDTSTAWEALAGYARAVRIGDRILVSGTTATAPDGQAVPGDAAAQARFILDKIERAIRSLGGRLADVVRTRIYVRRLEDWEPVARVHGARLL